jgi:hypothetical protein
LVIKTLDPNWIRIRIGILAKMLDPDPYQMNTDPQPWFIELSAPTTLVNYKCRHPTWIRILCECSGNAFAGGDALAGEGAGVLLEQGTVLEEAARHNVRPSPAHAPAKPVILPSPAVLVCQNQRCGTGTVGTVTLWLVEPEPEP